MWREESGFLEMFLAYYCQFEENVSGGKAYRDFLLEVLCAHEMSLTSEERTNQTQLEAAANALQFPWTFALPVEPSNEAAIQTKTEVVDDDCQIVCELPRPSKATGLTSDSEIETGGEMKNEDEAASRINNGSWCIRPAPNSEPNPTSISAEERGFNSSEDMSFESKATCRPITSIQSENCAVEESILSPCSSEDRGIGLFRTGMEDATVCHLQTISQQNKGFGHRERIASDTIRKSATEHKRESSYNGHDSIESSQLQGSEPDANGHVFACGFCNKRFSNPSSLRGHERIHCGGRPYACMICGKGFTHLCNLQQHAVVHSTERKFICKICSKSFRNSSNLRAHERVHTDVRPFVCKICGKGFNHSSNLNKHARVHTGDRPFVCKFCNKRFSQSSCQRRHERSQH